MSMAVNKQHALHQMHRIKFNDYRLAHSRSNYAFGRVGAIRAPGQVKMWPFQIIGINFTSTTVDDGENSRP